MKTKWIILLALAVLTIGVFWPATGCDFINLDDGVYVHENPRVFTGVSRENIRWAFTTVHEAYWLPLLWLSFMLDVVIFGQGPFGHHLVNILLHTANVLLLFWILFRMTGSCWRSAFVAALFAVHPLRVEAVVWITARKDTLSGLFYFLSLLAYMRYVEKPCAWRYVLILFLMLMGLMSKAILITLPFALLLLDYWPLRRAGNPFAADGLRQWSKLVREKAPLLLLAAVFISINLATHEAGRGAHVAMPLLVRLCLIPANYLMYIGKLLWPVNLAIVYPEADVVSVPLLFISLAILGAITWFCARKARIYPFLIIGWLWFLLQLFPVIRGVRLGLASMADRFAYLPSIGLFVLIAWAAVEMTANFRFREIVLAGSSLALLASASLATRLYMADWKDSETLFRRTLALTRNNYTIYVNLSGIMLKQERYEEQLELLREALRIYPVSPHAHVGLGMGLEKLGRMDEAKEAFRKAILLGEHDFGANARLAEYFAEDGRYAEAEPLFRVALQLKPGHKETRYNLGAALVYLGKYEEGLAYLWEIQQRDPSYHTASFLAGKALLALGRPVEAVAQFRQAVSLVPNRVEYLSALAVALNRSGKKQEAFEWMRKAVALAPDSPELLNNFAWMLATDSDESIRGSGEALGYAMKAAELSERKNAGILDSLSVAQAAAGQYDEAIQTAIEAFDLARETGQTNLQEKISQRVRRFKSHAPWVE